VAYGLLDTGVKGHLKIISEILSAPGSQDDGNRKSGEKDNRTDFDLAISHEANAS